jgi:uncharacterized membrane protein YgdD (TMEM256/DUF423 family)
MIERMVVSSRSSAPLARRPESYEYPDMNAPARRFLQLAALAAGLAVVLGAFGAHGLAERLGPRLSVYHTAVEYHFYHALGLAVIAFVHDRLPAAPIRAAGWLMVAGMLLFCGSLYVLSLSGLGWLGIVTPFGGLAFIAGWILLAVGLARGRAG